MSSPASAAAAPSTSSAGTGSQLTEEQRERIRRNREKALRIRAEKAADRQLEGANSAGGLGMGHMQQQQQVTQPTMSRPPALSLAAGRKDRPLLATANAAVLGLRHALIVNDIVPAGCSTWAANTNNPPLTYRKQTIVVDFSIESANRFKVQFNPFHMEVVNKLKTIPSKAFHVDDKSWSFLLSHHNHTIKALDQLRPILDLKINDIPFGTRKLFFTNELDLKPKINLSKIGQLLYDTLFPFQRTGVSFGIEKNGRFLMADEMGLGKSVQALAIANYYRTEWPLLIVCPSSVKYAWLGQLKRFMPDTNVYIIEKQNEPLPNSRNTSVVIIISYDLMVSKSQELKRNSIYAIIFDESHLLKEQKTHRTRVAFELSKIAHRVILLSGTPALSRPSELFSQIRMIDPKIFPNWKDYAIRYCEGKQGRFGFEAKGKSNPEELKAVMDKVMIRRLKKDVLEDLPEKRREIVFLSGDAIDSKMRSLKKAREACVKADKYYDAKAKKETFMEYYVQTGIAKMKAVADHVIDTFFHEGAVPKKVLVFAHHLVVLDTIGIALAKVGVQFIRIDGTTPAKDRAAFCELFQSDNRTMVALLSITAAGTGITLTAASFVVFAELYWNPSLMIQAEDRAHRVGQRDSVHVQYMLARNTADTDIWALVGSKLIVLGEVNLSNETYHNAENTEKLCTSNALITNFFDIMKDDNNEDASAEPEFKRSKSSELNVINVNNID